MRETKRTLDELVPSYAQNKAELDTIKKVCDKENAEIKEQMAEQSTNEYSAGGYTAKRIVVKKETMNEAKLIEVIKKHNIPGIIEMVEQVDMDELENYLYHNKVSPEFATDLNACKVVTEVVQLRISKQKESQEDAD